MVKENSNIKENTDKTTDSKEAKLAKLTSLKSKFSSIFQKFITCFVLIFCFLFFPAYLIYSSLDFIFESKIDNLKRNKISIMNNYLEYMDKYSNNKKYFHYLFSKISEVSKTVSNPQTFIQTNIENLKKKYPNQIKFVVWDQDGKNMKHLTDKESYSYILNKVYQCLKEVTETYKKDFSFKVSDIESVKKNINFLRTFFGRIFIPENLKFPLGNDTNAGPFVTEIGKDYSSVWFSINDKIGLLCFFTDDILKDFSGLKKITDSLNSKNPEIISGFTISPNIVNPVCNFPQKFEADLSLALSSFENVGDSIFENDNAIVAMAIPQPEIRTFCYLSKLNDEWNINYKKNTCFFALISILLAIYCFIGFWFNNCYF